MNRLIAGLTQIGTSIAAFEKLPQVEPIELDELGTRGEISSLQQQKETQASQLAVTQRDYDSWKDLSGQLAVILGREGEITLLEQNEQIYSSLQYAFGPKGLIVSRLDIICKYLTEKINFFLSRIMRDDIHIKFFMDGDSIDLDVTMRGKQRGIGNLSGGEEAKVGIACMLGLRSLMPDRYQTNILILDEPDSGWDDRVRAEFIEILESIQISTKLDSIFLITHSPFLQELQIWNNIWTVTKQNGLSSLSIESR
jgi:DNA repair exonuclease SbcCD ATPase subunit